jgi:hypothetical protein
MVGIKEELGGVDTDDDDMVRYGITRVLLVLVEVRRFEMMSLDVLLDIVR